MKVSYDEGPASHVGPESCVDDRKVGGEALTGEVWAGLLSPENLLRSADAVVTGGRQQRTSRQREGRSHSAWSKTPRTHRSTSQGRTPLPFGSREIPDAAWVMAQARAVNLKGERRR
jgi:hypothetical protein